MTFNAGLLNTNLATDVIGQTKMDLATPVNIFNSLQANKRANQQAIATQKLADLTLSTAEKEAKKKESIKKIMQSSLNQNGTINAEKAIAGFNQNGFYDEAMAIQEKMAKVAKERQEAQKAQDEVNAQVGNAFLTAVESPNQIESFLNAQKEAKSRGWNMSQDLINYQPTSEEINTGKLNPKIQEGLKYYGERFLTPEQKLARKKEEDSKLEDEKFFGNLIPAKDENGNMALFSTSNKGKSKQIEFPAGFELDPKLVYKDVNDKIVILDGTKQVGTIDKGVSKTDSATLELKRKEDARKEEEFQQTKIENAKKTRAYEQKNKGQIDSLQNYLDKAIELKNNPNLKYTTGASRANLTKGSKVPFISTAGKDAQASIDYLVSSGIIETMAKLKAESPTGSTGMGALSDKEMQVLKDSFSVLGNENASYEMKVKELDRVIGIMSKRLMEQRNLSRDSEGTLGPEPDEETSIRDKMKRKKK